MRKEIPPETFEDVELAVAAWEDAIKWISKGWDCIEEYTNDLSAREVLDKTIANCSETLTPDIEARIAAADKRFCDITHETESLVWGSRYDHQFNRIQHWYYYRWLNDDIGTF